MMKQKGEYKPTMGLEIHAELNTRTKMFCDSLNDPDEKHANINVCPVCLGHPGCLPVVNKKAIESVIRVGLALGGKIAPVTKFDRKNYFYPDLPKGYQISQYDKPLVLGGELCGIRITRIHLEEDAGNLLHDSEGKTLVDFNRAGVPLMELVTEPDIRSAEQAVNFGKELQRILRYLGVSDANMEKGEMRMEVNISMNMGTKAEIKNINSFKAVEGAIAYETIRQTELLEKGEGEKIRQETRGWDDVKRITVSQRSKENAHEYRYFPDPDLPAFKTEVFDIEQLRAELPELPDAKRKRFASEYKLSGTQADLLADDLELADYYEEAVSELKEKTSKPDSVLLYNYLTSDLKGLLKEDEVDLKDSKVAPEHLAHLVYVLLDGKVTTRQAKDMLRKMHETGEDVEALVNAQESIGEDALSLAVEAAIAENPNAVADYKKGKLASLQFLVGQVMKKTKGGAKPDELQKLLREKLG
ncbi:MAG: Asp-tRNA(Asn)/Glu-tRNA(Gln) amidotransferase subunit GatB [Candidatus Liptonbacteria bacterium]|nr:Asp-tRNA(Asn)/Glu-tRNA(Gln) amidotransferase subunit GatB [Candidatus Liptonbacteria bacterium]